MRVRNLGRPRGPKVEGGRVDAIARPPRSWTVVENVPEMRVATLTTHLGAMHAVTVVVQQAHVLLFFRVREARPTAMRLELGIGREERLAAAATKVRSVVVDLEKRSRKRRLGAGLAQNAVSLWPELSLPLLLAFLDFGDDVVLHIGLL
jgi:hypothetical protein